MPDSLSLDVTGFMHIGNHHPFTGRPSSHTEYFHPIGSKASQSVLACGKGTPEAGGEMGEDDVVRGS